MAGTPSKRERQREERRSQILDAALTVFSQKGYHATNVSDVAAQAGVSQGTIYWYFESKEDLFQAALLSAFMDIGEESLGSVAMCTTAAEKLLALAESMEGLAEVAEGLFMLFLGYWSSSDRREESAQIWIDLLKQYKDVVVAIVEEGISNGEFKPVDAEALVWALLAAYDGLAAYTVIMPDMDLKRISQTFVKTLLQGLTFDRQESLTRL
ncbi:MAG: TetR/AcrR family transcriptional regulator [Anaerolineae bacterium]|jgi:AcrR family transcriptional regulator